MNRLLKDIQLYENNIYNSMKCFNKLWHLLMLRLCGQLSKNAVHLNSHKSAFCVLVSFRVRSSKEA